MYNKIYEKIKGIIKENFYFILSLIAIVLVFNVELPYVIETPGGFIALDSRIKIDNIDKSGGDVGMAYVSMIKGSIPFLMYSYLNKNWDIVPKSELTYENETLSDMNKKDKIYMNEAIGNATINAYKCANKSYTINKQELNITYVDVDSDSELKPFDIVTKVNNISVSNLEELHNEIDKYNIGDYLSVSVLRDDKEIVVKSKVMDYNGVGKLGISMSVVYDIATDPLVDITIKNNESGPSGGFMMSLYIYNLLTDNDITKGKKIIGTGTIDNDGNVGIIGGVKYKLIGAVKNNAEIFLCPKQNYEEAMSVAKDNNFDIMIIGVATFSEALEELNNL